LLLPEQEKNSTQISPQKFYKKRNHKKHYNGKSGVIENVMIQFQGISKDNIPT
jgi:hypothetical protein